MTGKELRRSARKPWQPIAALLGISFTMPSATTASSGAQAGSTTRPQTPQQPGVSGTPSSLGTTTPFDMSTTSGGGSSNRQPSSAMQMNQSSVAIVAPSHISGAPAMSSRSSGSGSHH